MTSVDIQNDHPALTPELIDKALSEAKPNQGEPILQRLSDIEAVSIDWLWPGKIPIGKLSLIAGHPGQGKSLITVDMAARISTGSAWPGAPESGCEPGDVIFLCAEDDPADTVRPRVDAAGGDPERIHVLSAVADHEHGDLEGERPFNLARDHSTLVKALQQNPFTKLVVIDPISSYLGEIDTHRDNEIRSALAPLVKMATDHGVAIVLVCHFNKNTGVRAIGRVLGSTGFVALCRANWGVTEDPSAPDRFKMLPIKCNLTSASGGLAYQICEQEDSKTPFLQWDQTPIRETLDEAIAVLGPPEDSGALAEAADWLKEQLSEGPVPAKEIKERAKNDGIAFRTLERAKTQIGAESGRESGPSPRWVWRMIPSPPTEPEDRQTQSVAALAPDGGLDDAESEFRS